MSSSEVAAALLVRTLTMPSETNLNGRVFGGWILSELDRAAGLLGMRRAEGRCATVAVENLRFSSPLEVGEVFSIYGEVASIGRTSMHLHLHGLASPVTGGAERRIVNAVFILVAIDDEGRKRPLSQPAASVAPEQVEGLVTGLGLREVAGAG